MGIRNIHILTQPEVAMSIQRRSEALIQQRAAEHRAGLHTYGNMRRDCPLCQRGK